YLESAKTRPLRKVNRENIAAATVKSTMLKLDAYHCVEFRGKKYYVEHDNAEYTHGTAFEIMTDYFGKVIALDAKGNIYPCNPEGEIGVSITPETIANGTNFQLLNGRSMKEHPAAKRRKLVDKMAHDYKRTADLSDFMPDSGELLSFPAKGELQKSNSSIPPENFQNVDEATVWLATSLGPVFSQFPGDLQSKVAEILNNEMQLFGHIQSATILNVRNHLLKISLTDFNKEAQ
ncbi:MAG: hypothetical protein KDK41_18260, partial [Leptospiraceae bacterium]|nr:hypothetical protein [Leptospiraceae bacterium]